MGAQEATVKGQNQQRSATHRLLSNLLHAFSPGFKDDSVEASDPVLVSKKTSTSESFSIDSVCANYMANSQEKTAGGLYSFED